MQAVIFWCQGTQDETSLKMDKHGHFDCATDTQSKAKILKYILNYLNRNTRTIRGFVKATRLNLTEKMVGARGFEPPTPSPPD
jgi:hypothetical protein